MKTKDIQRAICKEEVIKSNLVCENVKNLFARWECDVLSLNKSGYLIEYEVKISRSDFHADKKKNKFLYYDKSCKKIIPNKLIYVCPTDLIKFDEVPDYAGIIYFDGDKLDIIKNAKFIHKHKHDKVKIMSKFLRVKQERLHLGCALVSYKRKNRL